MVVPRRLDAPEPTWERDVDVVIVGAGVAGLAAALACRPERSVLAITKDLLGADATRSATGDPGEAVDAADPHARLAADSLAAGVEVMNQTFAIDLVVGTNVHGQRQCVGIAAGRTDANGQLTSVGTITARAVVLACGGYSQVFASTSSSPAVTGDGIAMALRAGLSVSDMEFVEFHPTVMWRGPDARGQQALIPDAVREEGAVLYDAAGERIMAAVESNDPAERNGPTDPNDPSERHIDVAPPHVVAAAISERLAEAPGGVDDHVFLDATHLGDRFAERFPTVHAACAEVGLDPAADRIPVAPAAHASFGGIVVDPSGRTELAGLFAVGDTCSTGVRSADLLASDRLAECAAAGTIVGRALTSELPPPARVFPAAEPSNDAPGDLFDPVRLREVRAVMSRHVGVTRSASSLASATAALGTLARSMGAAAPERGAVEPGRRSWEATNLLTVATAVVAAALERAESRGSHRRSDHPDIDPAWARPVRVVLDASGTVAVEGTGT